MAKERLMGKGVASIGMKELIEEIEKKTKELKKSEEKYRELVKNAAEGIYRTTVNGKILEVNPVLLEFFGYENEEEFKAIGDISKVYQNPKDRKKFLKKLKKNGEIKEWEGHYRRKDGKPIITNEFARLIEKNGEEIIEGIIHDVTMERKMTIALEKSREKYRDLFENANDLIWIADRKGRYLSINKMFEEALGYNKKELIGSQSLDLISKKDKKEAIKYYKKTLHGEPQSYELEVKTNNGDKRIFMLRTRPIEENGKIISVHGIGRDITERKKVEDEIEFYNSLLRHGIYNKYQIASGYLELLKKTDLTKEQKDILGRISGVINAGSDLVDKVRKIQKVMEKHELEEVNLDSVIRKAMQDYSGMIEDEKIKISYEPSEKPIMVMANSLVDDIFSNLIQNAIEHSRCTEIKIFVKESKKEEKDFYEVCVEDNGRGILDREKKRVFEKLVKGKESRGSGLGLYLVKIVVENYGGSVEAKNRVNGDYSKGTRFNVYLPKMVI